MARSSALTFALAVATASLSVECEGKLGRTATCSPVLIVRSSSPEAGAPELPSLEQEDDARAVSLAMASLAPSEESQLVELVEATTARLEARRLPLGADLGDGDPLEELRRSLDPYRPRLTAAGAITSPSYTSTGLTVRPGKSCSDARPHPDQKCLCIWEEDGARDSEAERARFLAWSITHSALIRLPDATTAETFAQKLRQRSADGQSSIALVLLSLDLTLAPRSEPFPLANVVRQLRRALAANGISADPRLNTLAQAAPTGRAIPWLELPTTDVLIVPRLSALVLLSSFANEIESAAGSVHWRWIHRP